MSDRDKNLEEAINLLLRLHRAVRKTMEHGVLKSILHQVDVNIAPHHMVIMKIMDEEGMLCLREIGEIGLISKAQISKAVEKLTLLGMVRRVPDPLDRRKTGITLTEKGQQLVAKFDRTVENHNRQTLSWLSNEELVQLLDSLKFTLKTIEKF